jgi:hypothetical protein
MPQISLDWDTIKAAYPMRPMTGALKALMDRNPGTPCCVQMSHALSAGGCTIGPRSNRRALDAATTTIGRNYYLLAVDEMKWFLDQNFGVGEEISKDDNGKRRSYLDMKAVLNGRTGILVFFDLRFGSHTEALGCRSHAPARHRPRRVQYTQGPVLGCDDHRVRLTTPKTARRAPRFAALLPGERNETGPPILCDPPLRSSVRYTGSLRYRPQGPVLLKVRLEQTKPIQRKLSDVFREAGKLGARLVNCAGVHGALPRRSSLLRVPCPPRVRFRDLPRSHAGSGLSSWRSSLPEIIQLLP